MLRPAAVMLALLSVLLGTPLAAWSAGRGGAAWGGWGQAGHSPTAAEHSRPSEVAGCCCGGLVADQPREAACGCCRVDAAGSCAETHSYVPIDAAHQPVGDDDQDGDGVPCGYPGCPCGTLPRGPVPTGPQMTVAIMASTARTAGRWRVPPRAEGDVQAWRTLAGARLDDGGRWATRPAAVGTRGCSPRAVLCIWTT